MNKIHITIKDGVSDEEALSKVLAVVKQGRISKDNKLYCYLTAFPDGIDIAVSDYRKSDCFTVYRSKRKNKLTLK